MIEISATSAFLLYLFAALFLLFVLWLKGHFKQKQKKIDLACENIRVCHYCQNAWAAKVGEKISRCPVCKSLN